MRYGSSSRLFFLTEPAQCRQLRGQHHQLRLGAGHVNFALGVLQRLFGGSLSGIGLFVVQILAAHCRIGQHSDAVGLDFQNTAGDENKFFAAIGHFDAHRAGLDTRDQRSVTRVHAQFARFAGAQAKVALKLPQDGRRRLQGTILHVGGDSVVFALDGAEFTVAADNIDKARLVPDWAALGLAPNRYSPANKGKPAAKVGNDKAGGKHSSNNPAAGKPHAE